MSEDATLDDFADTDQVEDEGGIVEIEKPDEERELFGLGKIPAEWDIHPLSESTEIIPGNSPPSSTYNEDGEGLPFFQGNSEFGHFHPVADTWCSDPRKEAKTNDVLMSIRAPVGDLNIADQHCCIGRGLAAFRPEDINGLYLFYHLAERRGWLSRLATGSTFKSVTKSDLQHLDLPVPPIKEQRRIATVLYAVDRAIEKTDEIIEQTKRVKSAVSQHYFEDYDTIRREENPDSVDMVELSNLVNFKPGKAWKTDNLSEEGLKIVRISNLTGEKEAYWQYDGDYDEKRVIEDGDLLFSWAGMKSSIGVHIYHGEKALLNQHIYNLDPKTSMGREYLYYYLDYRMSDLYSLSQGGAVQIHLTKDIIERILVPKIDSKKQEAVVSHLSEIDDALQNEINQKNRLKRLKQGLMQDLLSGKVRTTDTNIEVPEHIMQHG
ncbi:restriction endonuclease subunit S [Haloarcula sp. S1CR25-12]|uniref:Restriction endonuclease subunit S n=1 Tax=Haloarcula saliterrae TaxID=2950534 RepID=A0ABU2FIX1_9EURY|nr:restriction endonuclease subunit S [Haloarcula sp. S1CR25-12]MDS0261888.1 restriction endonuclease subunit S [Haloarcula sp. S1CR25-12]